MGRSIRYNTVKATAPSRVIIFCYHLRVIRRVGQGVFPSGKMLLERFGLHQCQGSCVQPFQSKSRVHLEGASATVQQVAKHPNICRHRWNPNPKRARKSRKILCEYFCYTKRAIQSHLHESAVTPAQCVLSHPTLRSMYPVLSIASSSLAMFSKAIDLSKAEEF